MTRKLIVYFALAFAFSNANANHDITENSKDINELIANANSGNRLSQRELGDLYVLGAGVPVDYKQALSWYTKSAQQGEYQAEWMLGLFYEQGLLATKDQSQAAQWFKASINEILTKAQSGDAGAQASMGFAYEQGRGVQQSDQQAFIWLSKAANQGEPDAEAELAKLYEKGKGAPADITKAAAWKAKAIFDFMQPAEAGHVYAQVALGELYRTGVGDQKDLSKAEEWYGKAAQKNYPPAQAMLAVIYSGLYNNKPDARNEEIMLESAAASTDILLQPGHILTVISQHGKNENKKLKDGFFRSDADWYSNAAEVSINSLKDIKFLTQNGLCSKYFISNNYPQAMKWCAKLAESQGDPRAQTILGELYHDGKGVPQHYQYAKDWYSKAAAQGDQRAISRLNALNNPSKNEIRQDQYISTSTSKSGNGNATTATPQVRSNSSYIVNPINAITSGNATFYSDGTTAVQNGNTTYYSNGATATKNGDTTYYSNGATATQIGNATYYSEGATATKIGNTTYGSNGNVCSQMGSGISCN